MIPFYRPEDPWVPVYRECSGCSGVRPAIIFMRLVEGSWWHGARDIDESADFVRHTRLQIEKAMMAEVAMALTFMGFLLIISYSYGLDDAHSTMDLYAPLVN